MKLLRLTLRNFRQFRGEQVVDFAHSGRQNVTLIKAGNALGKTALLNSLRWGFFGTDGVSPDFCLADRIINDEYLRCSASEDQVQAEIVIEFEAADERLQIRRSVSIDQQKLSMGLTSVSLEFQANNRILIGAEAEIGIREILPAMMASLCFLSMPLDVGGPECELESLLSNIIGLELLQGVNERLISDGLYGKSERMAPDLAAECSKLIEREIMERKSTFVSIVNRKLEELLKKAPSCPIARLGDDLVLRYFERDGFQNLQEREPTWFGSTPKHLIAVTLTACLLQVLSDKRLEGRSFNVPFAENFPLVIDSPFCMLDSARRRELGEILAICPQQIVLFLGETEFADGLGRFTEVNRVGMIYRITWDEAYGGANITMESSTSESAGDQCNSKIESTIMQTTGPSWQTATEQHQKLIEEALIAEKISTEKRVAKQLTRSQRHLRLPIA